MYLVTIDTVNKKSIMIFFQLQKGSIPNRADHIQKKLTLIEEWASLIQSHCGTEQNVDKQTACITVIANNANFLLCDSNKILGNHILPFMH